MKKTDNKNIKNAILFTILGILGSVPLVITGAWPLAILVGGISSIIPVAVLLDKIGIIELVNVTKYEKIVNENGEILYDNTDEYKKINDINLKDDKKKRDLLFEDIYKRPIITEKTKENISKHPNLYVNCDVRTYMGKFYTDEQWEQRREELLNRPLPGPEEGPKLIKKLKYKK